MPTEYAPGVTVRVLVSVPVTKVKNPFAGLAAYLLDATIKGHDCHGGWLLENWNLAQKRKAFVPLGLFKGIVGEEKYCP